MNRIANAFATGKPLLNIFITAGYPNLNSLPGLANELLTQGVDILEIGLPYSDPLADGPVIQETSRVALENGITLKHIFKQTQQIRAKHPYTPLLMMGYLNQLLQMGMDTFLSHCQRVGVDGLIIPDLPVEIYNQQYRKLFEQYQIRIAFLVTPKTSKERIKKLDNACTAFLYMVSDNSITGGDNTLFTAVQLAYFQRIKSYKLKSPTMIGFGISTKKMVKEAFKYANGAIIGSAYLKELNLGTSREFIASLL